MAAVVQRAPEVRDRTLTPNAPRINLGATSMERASDLAAKRAVWNDALARYTEANKAWEAVDLRVEDDAAAAQADYDAWMGLFETPAPDWHALAWKASHLLDLGDRKSSNSWDSSVVRPVLADLERLTTIDAENASVEARMEAEWQIIKDTQALAQATSSIETKNEIWDRGVAAEAAILEARPATVRGATIQLLVSLLTGWGHPPASAGDDAPSASEIEAAITGEDYAQLSAWEEAAMFDWTVRHQIRALCTLTQIGG